MSDTLHADLASQTLRNLLLTLLPAERIGTSEQQLHAYGTDIDGSHCQPLAIVWPETEQEVQQLVELANARGLSLHPIASGRNWGYGTAKGSQAGQIILDFSRMARVLEVNDQLAYMRIQPGVTQQQAFDALEKRHSRLQLDVTAAGQHTSLTGNILERGFGHTDYCDRFSNVLSLKVLLPTGEIIQTGMGCYRHAVAAQLYPYGIGPVLHGLFSQSNLGIVLEMTLALQPKPEHSLQLILMTNDADAAPNMVAAIAELKQQGVIQSGVHTASMSRAFGEASKKMQGAWVLTASVSGPKALANAKFKVAKKHLLAKVARSRVIKVTDARYRLLNWANQWLKLPAINDLGLVLALKKGRPSDQPIQTLLDNPGAHSQMAAEDFPAHFRWICAVSSSEPQAIRALLDCCQEVFDKHGYEQRFTLTNISPRAVILIANIRYDKTEEATRHAQVFYQEMDQRLLDEGFCPYRSGSGQFGHYRDALQPEHLQLLQRLKQALDPGGLLSPGKYNMD